MNYTWGYKSNLILYTVIADIETFLMVFFMSYNHIILIFISSPLSTFVCLVSLHIPRVNFICRIYLSLTVPMAILFWLFCNHFDCFWTTFVSFVALKLLPRCKRDKLPQHALLLRAACCMLHATYCLLPAACCNARNFATNKISANANIRKSHSLYLHTRSGSHTHTHPCIQMHANCDQNGEMKSETTINNCSLLARTACLSARLPATCHHAIRPWSVNGFKRKLCANCFPLATTISACSQAAVLCRAAEMPNCGLNFNKSKIKIFPMGWLEWRRQRWGWHVRNT